jgi:carbonic anhydrase
MSSSTASSLTPDEALAQLMAGNERYVAGQAKHPHQDAARRAEVSDGQNPFAILLSCSDSRVPPIECYFKERWLEVKQEAMPAYSCICASSS